MTFSANFQFFYTVKKMLNHNLPTYNLPKHRSNDANILLTTCNDQQYNDEQRFTTEGSPEQLSGREAGVVGNLPFFCAICWFGKSWFGKLSSANYVSANCPLANCYPPKGFYLYYYFDDYFNQTNFRTAFGVPFQSLTTSSLSSPSFASQTKESISSPCKVQAITQSQPSKLSRL